MTGAQTLPANFINNGIVFDHSLVRVAGIARSGANFTVADKLTENYVASRLSDLLPNDALR